MSPDLVHSIKEGKCVRTIYVTAGDGGINFKYWQSREQGSEAAYNSMLGKDYKWDQSIVKLSNAHFVVVASPRDNPSISLVFMRLPDGNLRGEGFGQSHHESLAHLLDGSVSATHSVDGQSAYTSPELVKSLTSLVRTFKPTEISTQSNFAGSKFPDHSDHRAVSRYVSQVHDIYQKEQSKDNVIVPIKFYLGYPVHELFANVSSEDLAPKEAAFLAYSKFDAGVCQSELDCLHTPTYGSYLTRQYQHPY